MNEIPTIESNSVIPEISGVQPVVPVAEIAPTADASQPQDTVKPIKEQDATSEIKLVRSDIPVTSVGFPFINGENSDERASILSGKVRGESIPSVAA